MKNKKLNITKKHIFEFLANADLFAHLSKSSIQEISKGFELTYLPGNKVLCEENSNTNCLYVLMYGLLGVFKKNERGQNQKVSEIQSGSVVGEIGCIFDEPRTASIYTIRDSILLKITQKKFNALMKKHPGVLIGITKESIKRLANPRKYVPQRTCSCFTFIPSGQGSNLEDFAHKLAKQTAKYGDTLLLTHESFKKLYNTKSSRISLETAKVLSFFQELESKYRFILYVADKDNAWTERCLRQADRIFMVGNYGDSPKLNCIEDKVLNSKQYIYTTHELILLFNDSQQTPTTVIDWLKIRNMPEHYNIRPHKPADIARIARTISGNAIGLVLSGGGSLALAHVGTLRALSEAKIPIDFVGGTSMGGLVSALVAMEVEYEQMLDMLEHQLSSFQKKLDYTFPIASVIRARTLDKLLKESFGKSARIENLWQKYFCVSTNINTNELHIHDKGLLWQAIRASLSLPGILPVVFNKNHELLVDGGIANNLPVDIMQNKLRGKIIASSVKSHQEAPPKMSYEEYTSSGWHLFFKYFLLPKLRKKNMDKRIKFINIASIVQNSMIIASNNHQQEMIQQADYNIIMDLNSFSMVSFTPIKSIIKCGYQQAVQAIDGFNFKI